MIDFHAHLLPDIDDGSKNVRMSIAMLKESSRQGVEISVATPHFYFDKKIETLVEKREKAYNKIINYITKKQIETHKIILGFEVYLAKNVLDVCDLDKLCIAGTNTMLIEMPRKKWDDEIFQRLDYVAQKGYNIVLAHPERYISICEKEEYDRLFSYGFPGQLNATSLINPQTREFALKLIKEGKISIIGSDMHNMGSRSNFINIACEFIEKKLGNDILLSMDKTTRQYLGLL